MFNFEKNAIYKKGFVTVEFKEKMKKYGGKTVADGAFLSSVFGSSYFKEEEYDHILKKLSEFGLWLQTEIKEEVI